LKALLKCKKPIQTTVNYPIINSRILNITKKNFLGTIIVTNNLINNGQTTNINMVSISNMMDRVMVLIKEANIKIIEGSTL